MDLRPTQGDEKRVLFSNYCRWKRRPPLCHLDRSAAQWRDLRSQRSFPGNVFRPEKSWAKGPPQAMKAGPVQQLLSLEAPLSPLSSRPERSVVERSAVSAVLPWECFSTAIKTASVRPPHSPEAPPSPLSSRPERSVVERSAVSAVLPWECFSTVIKTASVQPPHSPEAPPSPLSSRPERSVVERSAVSAVLPWECFSTVI